MMMTARQLEKLLTSIERHQSEILAVKQPSGPLWFWDEYEQSVLVVQHFGWRDMIT